MISVENLGFAYRPGLWILRSLTFSAKAGEILGILAPNGRGKTTLLRTVMGLLRPQEGRVTLESGAGYVPQSSGAPYPYKALDMVVMGRARSLGLFRTPGLKDYGFARAAMELLGIDGLEDCPYSALSGGQQQMVLIARALASGNRCLILDEPASALDFKNQQKILGVMRDLSQQGISILFTTHNPQHVLSAAHKALLIYAPGECRFGLTEQVMSETNLRDLYGMDIRRIAITERERTVQALVPIF